MTTTASRRRRAATRPTGTEIQGRGLVGVFDFGELGSTRSIAKVAISTVSEDAAIANLEHDMPGWDFDAVREAARAAWTKALSAVDVDAPPAMTKSFYTALYHALIAPNLAMDVDGRYRGPDNAGAPGR